MGMTIFILAAIIICLIVGLVADAKNKYEERINYIYKIHSARYCNLQNQIKKLREEIEEMKGEEKEND